MNQDQRKFLIAKVEQTFKEQHNELKEQIPEEPSLNNYLIAAFLDNSIQFNDIEKLKTNMRETVLKYGISDKLVEENSWNSRKNEQRYVRVLPEDLFVLPENYLAALSEYQQKKNEIEKRMKELQAQKETIVMKLQIGSSSTLDKLIIQVDNMADLSIMNSQLLLGNGNEG
jgi:hypothetical protein